jgi:hypothetical protein
MTPVTARRKRERPKIESAGVETGEKTLVEPEGFEGDTAEAAVTGETRVARICITNAPRVLAIPELRICIESFLSYSSPMTSRPFEPEQSD